MQAAERPDGIIEKQKLVRIELNPGTPCTDAIMVGSAKLIKALSPSGKYRYAASAAPDGPVSDRLSNIYRETVRSITSSGNIVLVKSLSGCANAAAETLDNFGLEHVIGSVAGDNTVLLVVDDPVNTQSVVDRLNALLKR